MVERDGAERLIRMRCVLERGHVDLQPPIGPRLSSNSGQFQPVDRPSQLAGGIAAPLSRLVKRFAGVFGLLSALFGDGKAVIVSARKPV